MNIETPSRAACSVRKTLRRWDTACGLGGTTRTKEKAATAAYPMVGRMSEKASRVGWPATQCGDRAPPAARDGCWTIDADDGEK